MHMYIYMPSSFFAKKYPDGKISVGILILPSVDYFSAAGNVTLHPILTAVEASIANRADKSFRKKNRRSETDPTGGS